MEAVRDPGHGRAPGNEETLRETRFWIFPKTRGPEDQVTHETQGHKVQHQSGNDLVSVEVGLGYGR